MYKTGMRSKVVTLGIVLASTTLGTSALTLGRARGAAVIGQALELVVPVQVDAGQTDGTLCTEAEVFHGDSRQDSNRVQVQVESTGQTDTFNVRIISSALIDEPVVTVYLRAGCSQKFSRKFVLLADYTDETVSLQNRQATAPTVPAVVPAETKPVLAALPRPAASETTKAEAGAPKAPATLEKAGNPEAAAPGPKPDATPGKPRLRLEPMDTLGERIKSLESSTTINPASEVAARDNTKLLQLQVDLSALLSQAVKNEASLAAMRERLEKAESDRVPLTMVYGLIVLLVLSFGTLAFLLGKRPRPDKLRA